MKKFEVTEENVKAAFNVATTDETKKVLEALFGKIEPERKKPSLDDYTTIKSYEDACEALDLSPIYSDDAVRAVCENINQHWDYRQDLPKHIMALMKLETISRALWGREWQPIPDAEGERDMWYPWFALYTKEEVERYKDDFDGALLSGHAYSGTVAGIGSLIAYNRSSLASAYFGFRLCQETEEKAKYFGRTFIKLWAEYLAFNFTVGDYYFPNNK